MTIGPPPYEDPYEEPSYYDDDLDDFDSYGEGGDKTPPVYDTHGSLGSISKALEFARGIENNMAGALLAFLFGLLSFLFFYFLYSYTQHPKEMSQLLRLIFGGN